MSWTPWLNAAGLVLTLGAGALMTLRWDALDRQRTQAASDAARGSVTDASGAAVPVREYQRIASATTIADQVLVELVEPQRLVAVTRQSQQQHPRRWLFHGKHGIRRLDDLEEILALSPDLLFVSGFADPRRVARLRASGIIVFDLGAMHGMKTLLPNIRDIGRVVGAPERGVELARRFERRMARVAADVHAARRERGLYAGIHGNKLYGGTRGSSYHDLLTAAGLVDVAAEAGLKGWPAYDAEKLLRLDPPWIVTQAGKEQAICRHPGLERLRACREQRLVGIDPQLLLDPGLPMLEAAEAVHRGIYERPTTSSRGGR